MSHPKNQHYVPRFILRNFLVNEAKEQVSVYDKHTDRVFTTSIDNIMAENRFHDFVFDGSHLSLEPAMTKLEQSVLPVYQRIIETRRLDKTPDEKAALAFLIAFQFARTKGARHRLQEVHEQFSSKLRSMGINPEDLKGWEPATEATIKQADLEGLIDSLADFTTALLDKDFSLGEASPNRRFYLGDNPVCLNNARPAGSWGNIGLAVEGIEIYLPLSSSLMLCAWCPTLLCEIRATRQELFQKAKPQLLGLLLAGHITSDDMKNELDRLRGVHQPADELIDSIEAGRPHLSDGRNMDYYNSLQTANAYPTYVVCQRSDFELAKRHNKAFPEMKKGGQRFRVS